MLREEFLGMIQVVFLLFSLTFIFGLTIDWFDHRGQRFIASVIGIVFGFFGVINIALGIELVPGVVVDLRNPLVIVAGIYGGGVGAFVSAGIIALYRVFGVGGIGSFGGVGSILTVALMATIFQKHREEPALLHWATLGLISVSISAAWGYFTLPEDIGRLFLQNFLPIAIVTYPILTVILGKLIAVQYEQIQLRKSLLINEHRFRAIFDQAFQFIGLLKPDGVVIEANQTALQFAGVSDEEIVGKYFWEAPWWSLSQETQECLKSSIARAAEGEFVRYRVDVAGKNNQIITIDFSLKPIFDDTNRVVMLIPEGRDITTELLVDQQRLDIALARESNRILKQFIEDSSHHLRTPTSILSTSQYILKRKLAQLRETVQRMESTSPTQIEKHIAQLKPIIDSCEQRITNLGSSLEDLVHLVDELLELTGLDHQDVIDERLDVAEILRGLLEEYTPLIEKKKAHLHTSIATEPVFVSGDIRSLRLILQNLIDNALRYTPTNAEIQVKCDVQANHVVITVRDNGIGIPVDEQDQIFERFYRASNALEYDVKGTGLGLAIVKKIVDKHGGTITVESEIGKGATFTVTLPVAVQ